MLCVCFLGCWGDNCDSKPLTFFNTSKLVLVLPFWDSLGVFSHFPPNTSLLSTVYACLPWMGWTMGWALGVGLSWPWASVPRQGPLTSLVTIKGDALAERAGHPRVSENLSRDITFLPLFQTCPYQEDYVFSGWNDYIHSVRLGRILVPTSLGQDFKPQWHNACVSYDMLSVSQQKGFDHCHYSRARTVRTVTTSSEFFKEHSAGSWAGN
jgi:hypothetical protein